jgi:hypothetical protein
MKNIVLQVILIAALSLVLSGSPALSGSQSVYLQPEEGVFGFSIWNLYYEAVSELLLSSSHDRKCQAIFLPSFSEESAVYLVYDMKDPSAPPVVVSVKPEKQLWIEMQKTMAADANEKGAFTTRAQAQRKALAQIQSVVNRLEAPLDTTVAAALEQAWDAMLMRVHYPEKPELGLDGETCHFANFVQEFGYRTGKVWSPEKGTPSYELMELARALGAYPTLREADRKDAAEEMMTRARKLLALLDNSK